MCWPFFCLRLAAGFQNLNCFTRQGDWPCPQPSSCSWACDQLQIYISHLSGVNLHLCNQMCLYPKLNGYRDNGVREMCFCDSIHCACPSLSWYPCQATCRPVLARSSYLTVVLLCKVLETIRMIFMKLVWVVFSLINVCVSLRCYSVGCRYKFLLILICIWQSLNV